MVGLRRPELHPLFRKMEAPPATRKRVPMFHRVRLLHDGGGALPVPEVLDHRQQALRGVGVRPPQLPGPDQVLLGPLEVVAVVVVEQAQVEVRQDVVGVELEAFLEIQDGGVELLPVLVAGAEVEVGLVARRLRLEKIAPLRDRLFIGARAEGLQGRLAQRGDPRARFLLLALLPLRPRQLGQPGLDRLQSGPAVAVLGKILEHRPEIIARPRPVGSGDLGVPAVLHQLLQARDRLPDVAVVRVETLNAPDGVQGVVPVRGEETPDLHGRLGPGAPPQDLLLAVLQALVELGRDILEPLPDGGVPREEEQEVPVLLLRLQPVFARVGHLGAPADGIGQPGADAGRVLVGGVDREDPVDEVEDVVVLGGGEEDVVLQRAVQLPAERFDLRQLLVAEPGDDGLEAVVQAFGGVGDHHHLPDLLLVPLQREAQPVPPAPQVLDRDRGGPAHLAVDRHEGAGGRGLDHQPPELRFPVLVQEGGGEGDQRHQDQDRESQHHGTDPDHGRFRLPPPQPVPLRGARERRPVRGTVGEFVRVSLAALWTLSAQGRSLSVDVPGVNRAVTAGSTGPRGGTPRRRRPS